MSDLPPALVLIFSCLLLPTGIPFHHHHHHRNKNSKQFNLLVVKSVMWPIKSFWYNIFDLEMAPVSKNYKYQVCRQAVLYRSPHTKISILYQKCIFQVLSVISFWQTTASQWFCYMYLVMLHTSSVHNVDRISVSSRSQVTIVNDLTHRSSTKHFFWFLDLGKVSLMNYMILTECLDHLFLI